MAHNIMMYKAKYKAIFPGYLGRNTLIAALAVMMAITASSVISDRPAGHCFQDPRVVLFQ
jgi:hypothetical protein